MQQENKKLSNLHISNRVDHIYSEHVDLVSRVVYFQHSDVELAETACFLRSLRLLETLGTGKITVVLDCVGGDVVHALSIYHAIRSSPCEVEVRVEGYCMSAAVLILQAGDIRSSTPTSAYMIHRGTVDLPTQHPGSVQNTATFWRKLTDGADEILVQKIQQKFPTRSRKKILGLLELDNYISAQGFLELGLLDTIY